MYLTNTRPDISFFVNTLSQYLVKRRCFHLIVEKHVMRYLKGTIDFGLYYGRDHDYMDLDWAGSARDRKSTSCGCYCPGYIVISCLVRNSPMLLSVQLKHSTLHLAPLVGK